MEGPSPDRSDSPVVVPNASVIVCAYADERWSDTVAALDSLRGQTVAPAEIVLVIDYNERLFERAALAVGRGRDRNSATKGASGSRNSGVAAASGAVVAFLDDDAIADPDWLARLLHAYSEPNVAGVGGSITPQWPARRPAWFPRSSTGWWAVPIAACPRRRLRSAT